MEFVKNAKIAVNLKLFNKINLPDAVFDYNLDCPHDRQYLLRMMIKEPHKEFKIPEELEWCRELVEKANAIQLANDIRHSYCYITVRHGRHTATTEDVWHTDGFSTVISHIPEQNYIVTSNDCTEFVGLPIDFPEDFDSLKHNMVDYISKEVAKAKPTIHTAIANKVYVFDPYVIHRRPVKAWYKNRTFVRVTFVPIEIADDACSQNPLMAVRKYDRIADTTRSNLISYGK